MSQQYNIKWREQDEKELRRVVRNFNDKLRRLNKLNPENTHILPQFYNESTEQFESRLTMKMVRELIQTRSDFNRTVNMLKRFSKRGAEEIIDAPENLYESKTTKWQRTEMNRLAGIVNRKRKDRLEMLNTVEMVNEQGLLGYTLGQRFGMGLASKNNLKPTKAFTSSQSQTDIKYKARTLLNQARAKYQTDRDAMLKENFIRTLLENYKAGDIQDVISKIRSMPSDAFVLKFEAKGDSFEFAYPPDKQQYQYYLSQLKGYWLNDSILDYSSALTTALLNQ